MSAARTHRGRFFTATQTYSLRSEDVVITHLIARLKLPIPAFVFNPRA